MKIKSKIGKLNGLFKSEDSRFLLGCGFKFSGIYFVSAIFIYYLFWIVVSLNSVYFESKEIGFNADMRDTFFIHASSFLVEKLPLILFVFIILFFAGVYIGKLLLRPFVVIGKYASDIVDGKKANYIPDLFSDYKLLTRFSEFFFHYTEDAMKNKNLSPNIIPTHFTRIHSPPFEKVFFFHFILLILSIAICTGYFSFYISTELRTSIADLSIEMISSKDATVGYFMQNQDFIFNTIAWTSFLIVLIGYISLSFHLYSKVSGGIFAFFSTMRSFVKGSYKNRVHLVGYAHIRPYGRSLNKYLDHVERLCSK